VKFSSEERKFCDKKFSKFSRFCLMWSFSDFNQTKVLKSYFIHLLKFNQSNVKNWSLSIKIRPKNLLVIAESSLITEFFMAEFLCIYLINHKIVLCTVVPKFWPIKQFPLESIILQGNAQERKYAFQITYLYFSINKKLRLCFIELPQNKL